ncbi:hypothetical protein EVAR_48296_1 [Eumeta japonica]|uniref:Uncharacterized protein n=1 Tax=Eumeta variegata TaxID=151549 RepID=A0A4C1WKY0_EUMVA|nr:hypothetical protein EVAR_48296_1 [Eumeta japonica]
MRLAHDAVRAVRTRAGLLGKLVGEFGFARYRICELLFVDPLVCRTHGVLILRSILRSNVNYDVEVRDDEACVSVAC